MSIKHREKTALSRRSAVILSGSALAVLAAVPPAYAQPLSTEQLRSELRDLRATMLDMDTSRVLGETYSAVLRHADDLEKIIQKI